MMYFDVIIFFYCTILCIEFMNAFLSVVDKKNLLL